MTASRGLRVVRDAPVEQIRTFLERDVDRNLFILNDLSDPYAPYAEIHAALDGTDQIVAIVLVYLFPGDESLWPVGSAEGVRAILASTALPDSTVLVRLGDAADVAEEFMEPAGAPVVVQRMALEPGAFRSVFPGPEFEGRMVRVGEYPTVNELWNGLTTNLFPDGAMYGLWNGEQHLCAVAVAMAGNGVVGIGTIGGVHVDPKLRGQGLGRAVTALACRHWFESGRERAVLNVAAGNAAAIATYRAVGFVDLLRYTVMPVRRPEF